MCLKELFSRPRMLSWELARQKERLAVLRAACTSVTAGLRAGGRGSHSGGDRLADLGDQEAACRALRKELEQAERERDAFLERVRRELGLCPWMMLTLREARGKTWVETVERARAVYGPVSLPTVKKWHKEALAQAEKLWEDTKKPPSDEGGGTAKP